VTKKTFFFTPGSSVSVTFSEHKVSKTLRNELHANPFHLNPEDQNKPGEGTLVLQRRQVTAGELMVLLTGKKKKDPDGKK